MPTYETTETDLEHLAAIREILAPALHSGARLRTTSGEPVTFAVLPTLVRAGASIEMIGDNCELVAVTLPDHERPDTPRMHERRPAFSQIADDGGRTNYWLPPADHKFIAAPGYRPAPLDLCRPLRSLQLDSQDCIIRLRPERFRKIFKDRWICWLRTATEGTGRRAPFIAEPAV